jgi:hypothetical protein
MGVATPALNKSMRARMEIEKNTKFSVDEEEQEAEASAAYT